MYLEIRWVQTDLSTLIILNSKIQCLVEIVPLWINALYQVNLPLAVILLNVLFPLDGIHRRVMLFIPDEAAHLVF